MNKPLPIGFFQFDNLVRNRVPFYLLRSQIDVESAFGVMEKLHLRQFSIFLEPFSLVSAEAALKERQARLEDPVVVLCDQGDESLRLAQALADQGHLNVYYISGGWQAFLSEMKAEQNQ